MSSINGDFSPSNPLNQDDIQNYDANYDTGVREGFNGNANENAVEMGQGNDYQAARDQRHYNPNPGPAAKLEDTPGRHLQPVKNETFEDFWRNTHNLRVIRPETNLPGDNVVKNILKPGGIVSCYVNGMLHTHENKTPFAEKVIVTIPPYTEPSIYNVLSLYRQLPCDTFSFKITDMAEKEVFAEASQDGKGNLETSGELTSEGLGYQEGLDIAREKGLTGKAQIDFAVKHSLMYMRVLDWGIGQLNTINALSKDGVLAQDNLSRDSAFGFVARFGFEMNNMLFGKHRHVAGDDGTKFEPSYQFYYDLRTAPASLHKTLKTEDRERNIEKIKKKEARDILKKSVDSLAASVINSERYRQLMIMNQMKQAQAASVSDVQNLTNSLMNSADGQRLSAIARSRTPINFNDPNIRITSLPQSQAISTY